MFTYNDTINCSNDSSIEDDDLIPYAVKFWVYLIFLIPSIICSLFILYYLLCQSNLRHALHNHAIIIFLFFGLIYQITIYPWMLYFYHHHGIWERPRFFCTIWAFFDWGLYFTQTILFAWATIERHILIFHHQWLLTKKKRFFIHYLPLILLLLYCSIYYTIATFFPTCENIFNNYYTLCIELCSFQSTTLYYYETIIHQMLPNLIIILFSIALLLRVHRQKQRVGRSLQWRKHWKMTIQLLFVSILYLTFALPVTIMNFLHLCGLPRDATESFMEYLLFFNYCMMLLCPFFCALALPQLRDKIRSILRLRRQRRLIAPMTVILRHTVRIETVV